MAKQEQVFDSEGVPKDDRKIEHCPTCGHLLVCRSCGFTRAAHDYAIERKHLAPHEYKGYTND